MIRSACLLVLLVAPLAAQDAATAYRAGRHADALALYRQQLLAPTSEPGPLYFALGNCAYRLGRPAEAIWYYRCAQLRLPRDPEIAHNLALAQAQLGLAPVPPSGFARFTSAELALAAGLLQGLGLAGFVVWRRRRSTRFAAVALTLVGLVAASALGARHWGPAPREAIVLPAKAALRATPAADAAIVGEVLAGDRPEVRDERGRWVQLQSRRGTGWVEREAVGIVE